MDTKSQPLSFCQKLFNLIICKITPPPPTTATTPPDADIIIEFNHSNTSQNSSQINQPYTVQKGSDEKDQKQQQDKGKRPKKSVTIKEPVEEELSEMKKRRDEDEAKNNNKSNDQTHVSHTKLRPPRHWGPLLSVESNINEKSDAFIRSRKKAMGDPDKKS